MRYKSPVPVIKQLFLIASLFLKMAASAQENNFGIINYTVPTGYQLIKNDNVLTYYTENKSTGAYCNFFIYSLAPGQGSVETDFDYAWTNQVQKPFKVTGTATRLPVAIIKGWQFLLGNTRYTDNGVATLAMLITFSGENKMQSVCILSNSDKYKTDIENFIASIDVSRSIAAPASAPNTNSGPTTSVGKSNASATSQKNINTNPGTTRNNSSNNKPIPGAGNTKNINYEVWECHCTNVSTLKLELKTVVLSPDGRCLYHMPEKGLNGVTPDNSNDNGSWGRVTDKGSSLQLRNEQYGNMELYKVSSTSMSRYPNSKTTIYKKVKQVDGLRFEGAYSPELSYYNGKTDIVSRQIDPNKRPIIFFKKDGTYINEGIGFSNLTFNDDYALGKGTYEIINYSLILTTGSGRKLQIAFTPVLDANPAANDNGGLMINNILFYRLNKTFTPHN
ncbi:MAG: hypothetical protein QM731_26095 [Chitinophagaceae bacterium]